MATTSVNNIVRDTPALSPFPDASNLISAAISWNCGDLIYFDVATSLLKPLASDANAAAQFVGVAIQSILLGKPITSYQGTAVDASVALAIIAGPRSGVVATMKLKSGDAFTPGCLIYGTAVDAQTVSSAGTNAIGRYQGPSVTAGSSSVGPCKLEKLLPNS